MLADLKQKTNSKPFQSQQSESETYAEHDIAALHTPKKTTTMHSIPENNNTEFFSIQNLNLKKLDKHRWLFNA